MQQRQFYQTIQFRWVLAGAFALVLSSVAVTADAASYALQIIAPRAALTTANRYYKAYPGLAYDVKVLAIGGKYPYHFSLPTAPSGMKIDANSGVITWPSPVAQSQPYAVTASVADSSGASTQVNWTILVTTSGFKFVDAVNGKTTSQGGDGSAANPWKTMADWYVNKYDTGSKGAFLYFRNGTYRTADAPLEDGQRMAMAGSAKPLVWLAYPGESPVIDTTGSYICIYTGTTNVYFQGLAIQNFTTNFGIRIDSGGTDTVFRLNKFSNLPASAGGTGTNAAALMIAAGGSIGSYWGIVDNTFSGIYGLGYGILGYSTSKALVESNTFSNFTNNQSKAIGPKTSNTFWFIRSNRINLSTGQGIWVDTYNADGGTTGDIEISYNLVQVANGYTLWIGQEPVTYGAVTSFRNTYVGSQMEVDNLSSSSGPVTFNYDVIQNSDGGASGINILGGNRPSVGPVLYGSSGIVDSSGNLTGTYTKYVGTYGYQLGSEPAPPALTVK